MGRPPVIPVEKKTRIVLSVLAGEDAEAPSIVYSTITDFPLEDSANIVQGNALQSA
ncbi:hypothetical protein PAB09_10810 [Corynebacterium sp. SCR221107]|uniref:hypothetical protein n=1 Tax=Corynebacterium sp. SCR221107 TaxID=3017361 RepID=UPI0022EC1D95|nr:hypothetical protein [Corynebacterium sp. SCR221107]WBT08353.1 hypothetical protein PAB09_10810 [Corynebacterium sp. SCR221107]